MSNVYEMSFVNNFLNNAFTSALFFSGSLGLIAYLLYYNKLKELYAIEFCSHRNHGNTFSKNFDYPLFTEYV